MNRNKVKQQNASRLTAAQQKPLVGKIILSVERYTYGWGIKYTLTEQDIENITKKSLAR